MALDDTPSVVERRASAERRQPLRDGESVRAHAAAVSVAAASPRSSTRFARASRSIGSWRNGMMAANASGAPGCPTSAAASPLCWICIPGAALARVASEGFILLIGITLLSRMGIGLVVRPVLLPILAAGVMGASLLTLRSGVNVALCLALGLMIYLFSLLALKGIPQDVLPYLGNYQKVAGGPPRRS